MALFYWTLSPRAQVRLLAVWSEKDLLELQERKAVRGVLVGSNVIGRTYEDGNYIEIHNMPWDMALYLSEFALPALRRKAQSGPGHCVSVCI